MRPIRKAYIRLTDTNKDVDFNKKREKNVTSSGNADYENEKGKKWWEIYRNKQINLQKIWKTGVVLKIII